MAEDNNSNKIKKRKIVKEIDNIKSFTCKKRRDRLTLKLVFSSLNDPSFDDHFLLKHLVYLSKIDEVSLSRFYKIIKKANLSYSKQVLLSYLINDSYRCIQLARLEMATNGFSADTFYFLLESALEVHDTEVIEDELVSFSYDLSVLCNVDDILAYYQEVKNETSSKIFNELINLFYKNRKPNLLWIIINLNRLIASGELHDARSLCLRTLSLFKGQPYLLSRLAKINEGLERRDEAFDIYSLLSDRGELNFFDILNFITEYYKKIDKGRLLSLINFVVFSNSFRAKNLADILFVLNELKYDLDKDSLLKQKILELVIGSDLFFSKDDLRLLYSCENLSPYNCESYKIQRALYYFHEENYYIDCYDIISAINNFRKSESFYNFVGSDFFESNNLKCNPKQFISRNRSETLPIGLASFLCYSYSRQAQRSEPIFSSTVSEILFVRLEKKMSTNGLSRFDGVTFSIGEQIFEDYSSLLNYLSERYNENESKKVNVFFIDKDLQVSDSETLASLSSSFDRAKSSFKIDSVFLCPAVKTNLKWDCDIKDFYFCEDHIINSIKRIRCFFLSLDTLFEFKRQNTGSKEGFSSLIVSLLNSQFMVLDSFGVIETADLSFNKSTSFYSEIKTLESSIHKLINPANAKFYEFNAASFGPLAEDDKGFVKGGGVFNPSFLTIGDTVHCSVRVEGNFNSWSGKRADYWKTQSDTVVMKFNANGTIPFNSDSRVLKQEFFPSKCRVEDLRLFGGNSEVNATVATYMDNPFHLDENVYEKYFSDSESTFAELFVNQIIVLQQFAFVDFENYTVRSIKRINLPRDFLMVPNHIEKNWSVLCADESFDILYKVIPLTVLKLSEKTVTVDYQSLTWAFESKNDNFPISLGSHASRIKDAYVAAVHTRGADYTYRNGFIKLKADNGKYVIEAVTKPYLYVSNGDANTGKSPNVLYVSSQHIVADQVFIGFGLFDDRAIIMSTQKKSFLEMF